jgi:putative transposase
MWPNRLPRLKGFAYRGFHRYLVTVKAFRHAAPFDDSAVARELATQISPYFAVNDFEVLAYCVMPDHVHLLLEGTSSSADLREAVRVWKQRTGYAWKQRTGSQLWQPGFHDHILREGDDTRMVVRYVLQNPVRAGLVQSAGDYRWIGSSRYTVAELETHAGDWSTDWKRR